MYEPKHWPSVAAAAPRLVGAAVALLLAMTAVAACAPASGTSSGTAEAPKLADPATSGRQAATQFFAAVMSGEPEQVKAVLAPEVRIARANGTVIGRDDYLKELPIVRNFEIQDVNAVQSGDVLVVTYMVKTDQVVDGKQQPTTTAPRLSVFQWQDGKWLLVAHANFNAINK